MVSFLGMTAEAKSSYQTRHQESLSDFLAQIMAEE